MRLEILSLKKAIVYTPRMDERTVAMNARTAKWPPPAPAAIPAPGPRPGTHVFPPDLPSADEPDYAAQTR